MAQWLLHTVFWIASGIRYFGKQNIPLTGGFILASNHQSNFDPPLVGTGCRREITFAAKKELFKNPLFSKLITYYNAIPVRRSGSDKEVVIRLLKRLAEGEAIIMFPEGTRYLDGKLHPPKAGIGLIAIKSGKPIVPVYIDGTARMKEQFTKRETRITYGKMITAEEIAQVAAESSEPYQAVAWFVMNRIAETGSAEPPKPTDKVLTPEES